MNSLYSIPLGCDLKTLLKLVDALEALHIVCIEYTVLRENKPAVSLEMRIMSLPPKKNNSNNLDD